MGGSHAGSTLESIENFTVGFGSQTVFGDKKTNVLSTGDGNDTVFGGVVRIRSSVARVRI